MGRLVPFMAAAMLAVLVVAGCRSTAPDSDTATGSRSSRKKPPVAVTTPAPAGLSTHTVYDDGRERYVLVYRPAQLPVKAKVPLVLALHGGGGQPENMVEMSGLNALADTHGFAVAYPSGSGSTPRRLFWNILKSGTYATVNELDDVGFLHKVFDVVTGLVPVDTNRVYAAGFSQGAMMCYRLACDPVWSDRLAAMAVVGGTMTVDPADCHAARPVPLISFHGRLDPFSNYAGGIAEKAPRNDQVARPGVEESIRFWVERGGLDPEPSASGTTGTASMRQFGPDAAGFEVVSWMIEDGGHTWPGSDGNLPEWMMGRVNRDISASVLIWDFFARHPRNAPVPP
jgi:polyhydroxybutyrate depolymerase